MFTCSDATQQEIVQDAHEKGLDALVVASCSPKLHTLTFRDVARRAGLNPFQYTQVNIREQCSWTHTDDHEGATEKALRLVRAGINRTRLTEPLEPIVVETTPRSLVVGGGIAGLRAALGLAEIGLAVFLVEKEDRLGGWVAGFGTMYPNGRNGAEMIARLEAAVRAHPAITVFTNAELVAKGGSFGNYQVTVALQGERLETVRLEVGSVIVATGFEAYQPAPGELGYGHDGVVTLPELKRLLDASDGPLHAGRPAGARRSPTSTAWAAARTRAPRTPTPTARATAARLPSTPRSRRPAGATRPCASTTSTATCAPTASTSSSGASRASRARSICACPTTSRPPSRSSPAAVSRSRPATC